jgi:putative acyl-CoA dehydrogenase
MMRRAVAIAVHHASQRQAFGRLLLDQPLMRNVLADLALESEAATWLAMRLARALDEQAADPLADALLRVGTPIAKYWVCKRGPALAFEAMEVLGGNGYTEETPLARFYRELPVNSIWEGSGNVMCLDVLRALGRHPACRDALSAELAAARGGNRHYDAFAARLADRLGARAIDEGQARRLVESLARGLQASLLVRHAPAAVSDAFCASRLVEGADGWGQTFGTLPAGVELGAILERARAVA